jgi:hypothetical protein
MGQMREPRLGLAQERVGEGAAQVRGALESTGDQGAERPAQELAPGLEGAAGDEVPGEGSRPAALSGLPPQVTLRTSSDRNQRRASPGLLGMGKTSTPLAVAAR